MNQSSVSHYLNGVNPLNAPVAAEFSKILDVPVEDFSPRLARQIIEMMGFVTDLRAKASVKRLVDDDFRDIASNASELTDIDEWDEKSPLRDDEVEVPFLREVELAAGTGRFVIREDVGESLRFKKKNLRENNVQFGHAKCVTVRGNSMLPVLRDGATVGVDLGKTALGDVIDGDLYAINHNGQLRVKQLFRLPQGIRLRSFNRDDHPDEEYSFSQMQDEQIAILGHVFWWGMYAR
ncbi:helix-turn-helix transcriptional regulator [Pseudomonas extremaustralis]|uniref:S24 family peptidase n=1 Tax=Pseudomonas extremaustralis TaxID=359110 RepID=UPI0039842B27